MHHITVTIAATHDRLDRRVFSYTLNSLADIETIYKKRDSDGFEAELLAFLTQPSQPKAPPTSAKKTGG